MKISRFKHAHPLIPTPANLRQPRDPLTPGLVFGMNGILNPNYPLGYSLPSNTYVYLPPAQVEEIFNSTLLDLLKQSTIKGCEHFHPHAGTAVKLAWILFGATKLAQDGIKTTDAILIATGVGLELVDAVGDLYAPFKVTDEFLKSGEMWIKVGEAVTTGKPITTSDFMLLGQTSDLEEIALTGLKAVQLAGDLTYSQSQLQQLVLPIDPQKPILQKTSLASDLARALQKKYTDQGQLPLTNKPLTLLDIFSQGADIDRPHPPA